MRNRIKTPVKVVLLSLCFALTVIGAARPIGQSKVPELPLPDGSGDTPEIAVEMYAVPGVESGDKLKLSSLRGKVVLLDMFLSTCPHCQDHAPHIVALNNKYKSRGLTIIGMATDDKHNSAAAKNVARYINRAKINYPVGQISYDVIAFYADPKNSGVPSMVLFGPDGKMVFRETGWDEALSKRLTEAIEQQLEKLPTVKPGSKASAKPKKETSKLG
ncbi:MAG: TlpA disulfide reductase family protein [Acidobacteriota bacterium]|nr:TlpA disulfide reductase family protein [Acidobacteriota bacterium]